MPYAHAWRALTDLGGDSVMLPLILLIAVWLGVSAQTRRLVWPWLLLSAAVIAIVAITKMLYMGWHISVPGLDFIGLSGHAALAALLWPMFALMICGRCGRAPRLLGLAAGYLLAIGVAISRVVLREHSVSEAVLGCALGLLASSVFVAATWSRLRVRISGWWILLSLSLPLALGYGRTFPSKQMMYAISSWCSGHVAYTRDDLYRHRIR